MRIVTIMPLELHYYGIEQVLGVREKSIVVRSISVMVAEAYLQERTPHSYRHHRYRQAQVQLGRGVMPVTSAAEPV